MYQKNNREKWKLDPDGNGPGKCASGNVSRLCPLEAPVTQQNSLAPSGDPRIFRTSRTPYPGAGKLVPWFHSAVFSNIY